MTLAPAAHTSGIATLTVTIEDTGDTLRGGRNRFSRSFQVRVIPIPSLKITRSGTNVMITWPASATGYQLYSRTDFSPGSEWIQVTRSPAMVENELRVELEANGTQTWFRLQKP